MNPFNLAIFRVLRSKSVLNRLARARLVYGLAAVFLFALTATLIHNEIHPFHEHTAQCDVFEGVQNQVTDAPTALIIVLVVVFALSLSAAKPSFFHSQIHTAFQARAPPLSL